MPVEANMGVMLSTLAAPLLVEDFMFQFGDDGVILNAEPYDGPFVDITSVAGLDNAPVDSTERQREGMDGGFVDAEFESVRSIVLNGTAYGSESDLEQFLDMLKYNYAPARTSKPFYFRIPGLGVRVVYCKSLGVRYDIEQARRYGQVDIQFILRAEDSTIYGVDEITASAQLESSVAIGRGYNRSYDYGYGGSGQFGATATILNSGNRPADADIFIYGPITDPIVTHDELSKTMAFIIVIGSNEYLQVNLRNRTVRLNGVSNRRKVLLGSNPWFLLQIGQNTFRFSGTQHLAGPPDASLVIATRPAYR